MSTSLETRRSKSRELATEPGKDEAAADARVSKNPSQQSDEMVGRLNEVGEEYPHGVALVYVFNLIVGTGALTMPKAIASSGSILGIVMIVFIAFTSFVTATFTIEAMACANALHRWTLRQKQRKKQDKETVDGEEVIPAETSGINLINGGGSGEEEPLIDRSPEKQTEGDIYAIRERIEMGEMASLFFKKGGVIVFYLFIIVYLYGDLAIYAAAVPKSLRDVICNYNPNNATLNITNLLLNESMPCFKDDEDGLNRFEVYQIALTVFFLCMLPFVFFNVQKTKWLQILTTILRWVSFLMMISIAIARIAKNGAARPPLADIAGVPTLFGAAIYSFMCHHSLPSLISPIKDKGKINTLFVIDYSLILLFYVLLCATAIYAFDDLQDLYTLNFAPNTPNSADLPGAWVWVKYFIALFPVFTISASFPIIGITLRNNLKTLCQPKGRPYHKCVDRALFPLITVIPPVVLVYFTNDVGILVGITGAYAGAGIQYLLPAILVYEARKHLAVVLGPSVKNKHRSPFVHPFWIWLIVGWCCVALIFVTWDLIKERVG